MFKLGGKCLAYHGPLLYEAKILKEWDVQNKKQIIWEEFDETDDEIELPDESLQNDKCYYIHYQGWKSSWDEWIGMDRIRPFDEENITLKKKLIQDAKDAKLLKQKKKHVGVPGRKRKSESPSLPNGKGINSGSNSNANTFNNNNFNGNSNSLRSNNSNGSNNSSNSGNNNSNNSHNSHNNSNSNLSNSNNNNSNGNNTSYNNTGHNNNNNSSNNSNNTLLNKFNSVQSKLILHIPTKLKSILVDDWELVTKDKMIIELPCHYTFDHIVNQFVLESSNDISMIQKYQLDEFIEGLREYFQEVLPRLLLYRLERLQYDELIIKKNTNDRKLYKTYGSIHLLRLISILPELMISTTMDEQSCQLIIKQCENLLIWLTLNIDKYYPKKNNILQGYVHTSSQYEGVALGL